MRRHTLRPDQVEDLAAYMENDPAHGLEELWEVLEPGWRDDDAPRLAVTKHQLPHDQGSRLGQASIDGGVRTGAGFPAGLWLNYGPSTAPEVTEADELEPLRSLSRVGQDPTAGEPLAAIG